MTPTIAILIGFLPDPRIYNRINLEKEIGHVHLICWDRGNSMQRAPIGDGYDVHIIKLKAGGNPLKRLIPYDRFCRRASALLNTIQPEVIHVQGLDMLKIACDYKKKSNKSVHIIYEVADIHRLLIDQQKSMVACVAQRYLRCLERRCEKQYDFIILTSQKYYDAYFVDYVSKEKVLYMPNVPDLSAFHSYRKKEDGDFAVGYIGGVRYKQQMINLIQAAERTGDRLFIAGFEDQPRIIEPMCQGKKNIEWVGRFDFKKQAAELYGKCDVMYSVYNADMHNVRVALPNKLYESVYCGIPLIVAKNTYLSEIVREWGVGVAVDHKSVDELVKVLQDLKSHPEKRAEISRNCRKHRGELDLRSYNEQLKGRLLSVLGDSNRGRARDEACAGDN